MSNVFRVGWFLLMLPIVLLSCKNHNREIVDQQYLKSHDYTVFENKANQEKKQRAKQRKTLTANLELLPRCEDVKKFSLPVEISEKEFPDLLKNHSCDVLDADSLGGLPLEILGKSHFRDADTYFVLLGNNILSANRKMLAVTFNKDSELLDFEEVGAYKKSVSNSITTDLKLGYDGEILKLTSIMIRNIKYPIKQNYKVKTQYEIDGRGDIRKI
ncbi:MAG TPA: hypothetical protein VJ964_04005 [Balneolaceae bacterium]|nr:hypothetical protein [Balneolaceae bacterium]